MHACESLSLLTASHCHRIILASLPSHVPPCQPWVGASVCSAVLAMQDGTRMTNTLAMSPLVDAMGAVTHLIVVSIFRDFDDAGLPQHEAI